MTPSPDRPAVEVADVIRQHGAAFRARYGRALAAGQRKALRDLARCRTAGLILKLLYLPLGNDRTRSAYSRGRQPRSGKG